MNELHIDKTHWKKYRFDEVCRQVNEATKDPQAEGLDHVIWLEHIEPNKLQSHPKIGDMVIHWVVKNTFYQYDATISSS